MAITIPVATDITHRETGTTPLAVYFDASGVTQTANTTPFHNLLYIWNFGDVGGGNWTYGADTTLPKNGAFGPQAAHIYESAGEFTWTLTVIAGNGDISIRSGTITATAADVTFSGTNTICVSVTGDFTGAPAGAETVTSADFDNPAGTALATSLNAGKRVLYCGGETFIASTTSTCTGAGPAQVGSYGTGRAKLQWTGAASTSGFLRYGATCADFRVTNIEFDGEDLEGQTGISFQNSAWTNALLFNNRFYRLGNGLGPDWAASGGSGFFMFQNVIESPAPTMNGDGIIVGSGSIVAVIGNNFAMDGEGQQAIRLNHITKYVVSNNDVSGVIATKSSIDFRSSNTIINQYGVASCNYVEQGTSLYAINPSSASTNLGIFDLIIEKNYVIAVAGGSTNNAIATNSERTTVRNNLIDASAGGMTAGITLRGTNSGGSLPSKDVWVYNNTIYAGQSSGSFSGVTVDTTASTGNIVCNNLVSSPNIAGVSVTDVGDVATKFDNSTDDQSQNVDPDFDGPLTDTKGFRISTTSYAATGGTSTFPSSNSDFFNCDDVTANVHIGAMVPRARATCRGVK
jgi:hypothetical protein